MILPAITAYLEAQGLVIHDQTIFESDFPDYNETADRSFYDVCTRLTGPEAPSLASPLDYIGLQVLVRAEQQSVGTAKAWAIYSELHGLHNMTLSGFKFLLIKANHPPVHLGVDKDHLHRFDCNYTCMVENPTKWRS
jgi:hypothetical protein